MNINYYFQDEKSMSDDDVINENEIQQLMNVTQDFFEEKIIPLLKKFENDNNDVVDMTRYIMFVNAVYALQSNGWTLDELQDLVTDLVSEESKEEYLH